MPAAQSQVRVQVQLPERPPGSGIGFREPQLLKHPAGPMFATLESTRAGCLACTRRLATLPQPPSMCISTIPTFYHRVLQQTLWNAIRRWVEASSKQSFSTDADLAPKPDECKGTIAEPTMLQWLHADFTPTEQASHLLVLQLQVLKRPGHLLVYSRNYVLLRTST